MEFRITKQTLEFLIENIEEPHLSAEFEAVARAGEEFAKGRYATGRYVIDLSQDEAGTLVDELSDILASRGVSNGEINSLGRYVDDLVGIFGTCLWD